MELLGNLQLSVLLQHGLAAVGRPGHPVCDDEAVDLHSVDKYIGAGPLTETGAVVESRGTKSWSRKTSS